MIRSASAVLLAAATAAGAAGCAASTPTAPSATTYTGTFSAMRVDGNAAGGVTCTWTTTDAGTVTITLTQNANGTVSGSGLITHTLTPAGPTVVTGGRGATCPANTGLPASNWGGPLTGTTSNLAFSQQATAPAEGTGTIVTTLGFTGALSGGVITGTVSATVTGTGTSNGLTVTHTGSMSAPVTLR
ncbi:MAG TPA: hypothetical protein VG871_00500 [Vicinamibacterales bacterium]|nr:hypothetical protein [Vicinamibacterales bacterium]